MGSCSSKGEDASKKLSIKGFKTTKAIGRGGFGKVHIVERDGTKYAMKEMLKARVMHKDSVESVMKELEFLRRIDQKDPHSKFIVNVKYAFHDAANMYLVIDLLTGGDFRFHLLKEKAFQPECTQFNVACIALALDACHKKNIIHRDLKPENIVFDDKGYLKLTDFGIADEIIGKDHDNHELQSGTPGYMAPEVMLNRNHGFAADYFALGVIAYECMVGKRPYRGKHKNQIRDKMMAEQVVAEIQEPYEDYSSEAADFINQCILKDPKERIKCLQEVIDHPWFKNFDWEALKNGTMIPLYMPANTIDANFDAANVKIEYDDEQMLEEHIENLKKASTQEMFNDYFYNIETQGQ